MRSACSRSRQRSSTSSQPISESDKHLEFPVEDLLRRARPLPPHDEMVIDDLDVEEGMAFLAALEE
jgi:hypothetical protein